MAQPQLGFTILTDISGDCRLSPRCSLFHPQPTKLLALIVHHRFWLRANLRFRRLSAFPGLSATPIHERSQPPPSHPDPPLEVFSETCQRLLDAQQRVAQLEEDLAAQAEATRRLAARGGAGVLAGSGGFWRGGGPDIFPWAMFWTALGFGDCDVTAFFHGILIFG